MAITDRVTYPKPTVPLLSAAGYKFTDPTFGSRMVRVTDGQTAVPGGGMANISFRSPAGSPQRGWNADSTRFYVQDTFGNFWPFTWDASTMTPTRGPSPMIISGDVSFHDSNPNLAYGRHGNRVVKSVDLSVSPTIATIVVDLDTIIPGLSALEGGNTYTGNISVQNNTVVVSCGAGSNDYNFYCVWYPISDPGAVKVVNTKTRINPASGVPWNSGNGFTLHSTVMDMTARYVRLQPANISNDPILCYLWDTTLDVITPITAVEGGHGCVGFGTYINQQVLSGTWDPAQWVFRNLATPNSNLRQLISPVMTPPEIYMAEHPCWHNCLPTGPLQPMTTSTYRYYNGTLNTAPFRAWDDEVLMVKTEVGPTVVWRICHHRANVAPDVGAGAFEFWFTPRGNISPNGRWVLFTSNWEKTLGVDVAEGISRQDAFIVEVLLTGGGDSTPAETRMQIRRPVRLR